MPYAVAKSAGVPRTRSRRCSRRRLSSHRRTLRTYPERRLASRLRDADLRHRCRPGRLDDRRGASRRACGDGVRHRPRAADCAVASIRRRHRRGQRRQPCDPPRRGHRARGPRHRVHVAGRAEHHRRDARPKARTTRADDRPHVERRVPRAMAGAPAGRRLRRLVRARGGARGHDDDRRPRRAADGRLRRGAGADRRVRRRGGCEPGRRRPSAQGREDPARLEGREHHPRRRADPAARRRVDPRRRPHRRHRLSCGRACLEQPHDARRRTSASTTS